MSTVIRLFVKPRTIPGLVPAKAVHPWMNTNKFVQQRRMTITEDSDEHSESQPEKEIKRSPVGGANLSGLENRVFRLEDNFAEVTRDIAKIYEKIGAINGEMVTMKWQLGVLLAIGLTGSGSMLLFLLKKYFDEPKNEFPDKAVIRAIQQEVHYTLESMKPTDSAKNRVKEA
ncbi:hypothetical protein BDD12DRAFT_821844 [Trichophaea hybrida]|nr:hypothetical protein BDD12DRAFT_821844 [Trichophaea hybrida]